MLSDVVTRIRELADPLTWRMYMATVIGRTGLRATAGTRRTVNLAVNQPGQLFENTTRDRAMLAYVFSVIPVLVRFSPSPDAGPTNPLATIGLNIPGATLPDAQIYVLRPSEQLFATAPVTPANLVVSTEYF